MTRAPIADSRTWLLRDAQIILAMLAVSCAEVQRRFVAEDASDLAVSRVSLSVMGVYRDGALNEDDSKLLGGSLSRALGAGSCEPGYGAVLRAQNPAVLTAIELEAEKNGVGDEFLESVAEAALGDYILMAQVYGDRPPSAFDAEQATGVLVSLPHGRAQIGKRQKPTPRELPSLEVVADVYSIRDRHVNASLGLAFDSSDHQGALRELAEMVRSKMPNAACSGWRWDSVQLQQEHDTLGLPMLRFRLVPMRSH